MKIYTERDIRPLVESISYLRPIREYENIFAANFQLVEYSLSYAQTDKLESRECMTRSKLDMYQISTPNNILYEITGYRLTDDDFWLSELNKFIYKANSDVKIYAFLHDEIMKKKAQRILNEIDILLEKLKTLHKNTLNDKYGSN
ncbi:hypothetical protein KC678_02945 [Candidatus Dojkabacteria bacterium]|uniref:Uncharacterized protein n=1 Tax=Candidatus Dojkabacteria bacterium TaxID=2099670 RepID=A0A955L1E1_9BACT|nr:hypothetical protein [Candidatus Dojkabacteria bacterium]